MKFANIYALIVMFIAGLAFSVYAGKDDCENIDGDGAKPIKEVAFLQLYASNHGDA